jgi:hypothetical protein
METEEETLNNTRHDDELYFVLCACAAWWFISSPSFQLPFGIIAPFV